MYIHSSLLMHVDDSLNKYFLPSEIYMNLQHIPSQFNLLKIGFP